MSYSKTPRGGRGLGTDMNSGKPIAMPIKTPIKIGTYRLPGATVASPPPPRIVRHPGPSPSPMIMEPRDRTVAIMPDLVFDKVGEDTDVDVELFAVPNPLNGDPPPAEEETGIAGKIITLIFVGGALYLLSKG